MQASKKDATVQDFEIKMREEMEHKLRAAEEQHQAEMQAQEKKFKMQAKKNKEEFRKLMNEKGANEVPKWHFIFYQFLVSIFQIR